MGTAQTVGDEIPDAKGQSPQSSRLHRLCGPKRLSLQRLNMTCEETRDSTVGHRGM